MAPSKAVRERRSKAGMCSRCDVQAVVVDGKRLSLCDRHRAMRWESDRNRMAKLRALNPKTPKPPKLSKPAQKPNSPKQPSDALTTARRTYQKCRAEARALFTGKQLARICELAETLFRTTLAAQMKLGSHARDSLATLWREAFETAIADVRAGESVSYVAPVSYEPYRRYEQYVSPKVL